MSKPPFTLEKAIDLGEWQPQVLAKYPEWNSLSKHARYQLIRQGMKNHRTHLRMQWAEISNQPNFSQKPHLKPALKKIEKALKELTVEEEMIQIEYAGC